MTQQLINIGTVADDDTGDPLRTAGGKINDNFTELYATTSGIVSPADYGLIADGSSHTLLERYATLAEAQEVYPFATNLNQQIDYCAVQQASNVAFGGEYEYDPVALAANQIGVRTGKVYELPGESFTVDEHVGKTLFIQFVSNDFIVTSPIVSNTADTVTTMQEVGGTSGSSRWVIGQAEHAGNYQINKQLWLPPGRYFFGYDTWKIRNLGSGIIQGAGKLVSYLIGYNTLLAFDGMWYTTTANFGLELQPFGGTLWAGGTAYYKQGDTYAPSVIYDPLNQDTWMCMEDHTSAAETLTPWATATAYTIGDKALDDAVLIDATYYITWVCLVEHTSGGGTFADDRTANPTYWLDAFTADSYSAPGRWEQMHAWGAMNIDGNVFGQGNWESFKPYPVGYRVFDSTFGFNDWVNDKIYIVGYWASDPDDDSLWVCLIQHTSAAAGTFAADRTANPTFWITADYPIWANSTGYIVGDMTIDFDLGLRFVCSVAHTSAAAGTFEDDRAGAAAGKWVKSTQRGLRWKCRVAHTSGTTFARDRAANPSHWVQYFTRSVQGTTHQDMIIGGGMTKYALTFLPQASSFGQGDQCTFINLHINSASEACYFQSGFNALSNQFLGGNFQSYTKHGIFVDVGTIAVYSTAFQSTTGIVQYLNGGWDIHVGDSGAFDCCPIYGCRSESIRFIRNAGAVRTDVRGCTMRGQPFGWAANTVYALNAGIGVPSGDVIGRVFKCVTAGTSGSVQPTWPIFNSPAFNDIIPDGTAEWQAIWFDSFQTLAGEVDLKTCATNVGFINGSREHAVWNVTNATSPYDTFEDTRPVFTADCTAGPVTIWLPAALALLPGMTNRPPGIEVTVKKVDTTENAVTINSFDMAFEDGTSTKTIAGGARSYMTFMKGNGPSGVAWLCIGQGTSPDTGGTVTQATSKSTGVTLHRKKGQITMNAAALAAGAEVGFTLTNAAIAASDVVIVNIASGATADSYTVGVDAVATGSCRITLSNVSAGSLSEAVVLNYVVV